MLFNELNVPNVTIMHKLSECDMVFLKVRNDECYLN